MGHFQMECDKCRMAPSNPNHCLGWPQGKFVRILNTHVSMQLHISLYSIAYKITIHINTCIKMWFKRIYMNELANIESKNFVS
jgi:hypothetical protein